MSGTTKAVEESATPPASAKKDGGRVRSIASWVLVVIGSILVPVAVVAFWGQRTITDAERYIDTVGPLAAEEAIKTAIINKTTESLENALQENQATSQLLDALPPEAAAKLSAPIGAALNSLVDQVVTKLVYSDQFEQLWIGINEKLQEELVAVLSGEKSVFDLNESGQVVLDTGEVAAAAQQQLVDRGLTFLEGQELPAGADQQIVLLQAEEIKQIQTIYAVTVPLMRLLVPLVALIFIGAVLLSRRRSRTVMGIGIGIMASMSLLAFALTFAKSALDGAAPTTIAQNALNAFYVTLTRYLSLSASAWITGGAILALLGWYAGRSKPATQLRTSISSSLENAGKQWSSAPGAAFFRDHRDGAFIGISLIAVLLVLLLDPITPWGLIWITVLALGAAALVVVIGASGAAVADGGGGQSGDGDGGPEQPPTTVPTAPTTTA